MAYATDIGARNIHVMAGFSAGTEAHETFVANLTYACALAAPEGITILIEPLNRYDAPGYFLQTTKQATAIIAEVDAPNLKIMFDCYHVQLMEGDLTNKLTQLQEHIGHIQVASVPDRGAPDHGEINFDYVFRAIKELGFEDPTPIQAKTIPHLISSKQDLIATAQTGTGKTAAFGLPAIQLTDVDDQSPQTLVLCPTRELCLQIASDHVLACKL